MADTATKIPLASVTLSSATSSVTFSGISQSYTDFKLVLWALGSSTKDVIIRFNSDTGTNYSYTQLIGDGSSASSSRASNSTSIYVDAYGVTTTDSLLSTIDIMNYSNTSTYKSILVRANDLRVGATAGLWRNTSAITNITLSLTSSTFASGSTFNLYGIL